MVEESKSHWDELARQLGLEPKAQPDIPPAPRDIAPPMPSAPVEHTPESGAEVEERAPVFEDETMPEEQDAFDLLDEPPADDLSEGLEIADFTTVGTEIEIDEAVPEPKRRRGRRSRSGRGPQTESSSSENLETAAPPDSASADEASEPPRGRRGRGRGRRKKGRSDEGTSVPPEDGVDAETEPATDAVADEDDNEEIDNLSDWNVPSWQELIASLYRPER